MSTMILAYITAGMPADHVTEKDFVKSSNNVDQHNTLHEQSGERLERWVVNSKGMLM